MKCPICSAKSMGITCYHSPVDLGYIIEDALKEIGGQPYYSSPEAKLKRILEGKNIGFTGGRK